jgi:5-methyltetrahydropteroyltriglutamate--homocysteine methyltransferase
MAWISTSAEPRASANAMRHAGPPWLDDANFLCRQTAQPTRWALPCPMTLIDALYDACYKSREKLAWQFAKTLNE